MRLRQIALVAADLRPVEEAIADQLGLEVCYRDPGLAAFGLRHGLYPIGDHLLEVVVSKQPGTTAERYLERRGGDGGYMVLVQTDDLDAERARVTEAGFRLVHDGGVTQQTTAPGESPATIHGIHLHPKDVGGAILSIDQADPPESWGWAGYDWAYHSRDEVVTDLVAIDIQSPEPTDLAARWGRALDHPVTDDNTIELSDATIRFVDDRDGRGEGLAAADLVATDRGRVGESAASASISSEPAAPTGAVGARTAGIGRGDGRWSMTTKRRLVALATSLFMVVAACGGASLNEQDEALIDALTEDNQDLTDAGLDGRCVATETVSALGGAEAAETDYGITPELVADSGMNDIVLTEDDAEQVVDGMFDCNDEQEWIAQAFSGLPGVSAEDADCIAAEVTSFDAYRQTFVDLLAGRDADSPAAVQIQTEVQAGAATCGVEPG